MKENFSKRVQYVIKQSKEEAIRLGHSYVGSEHLLIGLLKSETGMAKKIIDVFDIDSNDMISMIEDMIKSSGGTMTLGHLPLTRRAERILRNAFSEASTRGEAIADDEHAKADAKVAAMVDKAASATEKAKECLRKLNACG